MSEDDQLIPLIQVINKLTRDPLFLFSLVIWGLNDHCFKQLMGGLITGKLSDVVSLICAPIIIVIFTCLSLNLVGVKTISARIFKGLAWGAASSMALLMIGINLSASWARGYQVGLGWAQWPWVGLYSYLQYGAWPPAPIADLTMDPSDIWTAPSVIISVWITKRVGESIKVRYS